MWQAANGAAVPPTTPPQLPPQVNYPGQQLQPRMDQFEGVSGGAPAIQSVQLGAGAFASPFSPYSGFGQ